jgi:hypothetical protein
MSKNMSTRWPWRSLHQRLGWPDMTQKIPVIVRISQAQTVFGVHRSTLYRWAKSEHITIHRRGAMSFVDPSEVYNFIINGEGTQWGPARKRTKFMNDINEKWCGRGDSNPHECYFTATSTLRVYQFRHDRRSESVRST